MGRFYPPFPVSHEPDREDEYNRWYDEVHLGEVLRTPGMIAARRYRLVDGVGSREEPHHRYLAIYEFASEDANATVKQMPGLPMNMSDALDTDHAFMRVWEACSDRVEA